MLKKKTVKKKKKRHRDFPGSPVVKTSPSNAEGADSTPGRGAKIPHNINQINKPINHNIIPITITINQ